VGRTDTVSGIPSCVDDIDNHCDCHSVYVHLEIDTREDYRTTISFWQGINTISMALELVARKRRHVFIGTGVSLLIGAFASALLLAGCSSSSPMMPSIFLMSLWYDRGSPTFDPAQADPGVSKTIGNIVGDAKLEARVGYVTGRLMWRRSSWQAKCREGSRSVAKC